MPAEISEPTPRSPRFARGSARALRLPVGMLPRRAGVLPDALPEGQSSEAILRRDAVFRRTLAGADVLSAGVALLLGQALFAPHVSLVPLVAIPMVVMAGKLMGLYDRDEYRLQKETLDEAPMLFQVATLFTLLAWVLGAHLGPSGALAVWTLSFVLTALTRHAARSVSNRMTGVERCLVLGDADAAYRLWRHCEDSDSLGATVVGRVSLARDDRLGGPVPLLGGPAELSAVLGSHDIHRVVIAPVTSDSDEILDAIRLLKSAGVKVSVRPRLFEVVGSSVELDDVQGMVLLGVRRHGLSKSSRVLKRAMDLVVASVALVVLSPLMALIALLVKLTSHGPVLFSQCRIGRDGARFTIIKFRTMIDGADELKLGLLDLNEADGLFKIANDPRLTPVGRALRRLSLDELPQLVNVLRGEMSLVGPRPLVPDDDRLVEGWQRRRLEVTPGMTGIWQVLGSSRIPLREMVKLDYLYGSNWSLWTDVKIMLRTIPYVLSKRGL